MNMHVPKSIKISRFQKSTSNENQMEKEIKSFEYLNRVLKEIVVSEKYLSKRDFLIVNVSLEADKIKIKKAMEGISEGNKVIKILVSNRKPYLRKHIMTKPYKRMYIRFEKHFDLSILSGGVS
jgi:ribosomal protein L23